MGNGQGLSGPCLSLFPRRGQGRRFVYYHDYEIWEH